MVTKLKLKNLSVINEEQKSQIDKIALVPFDRIGHNGYKTKKESVTVDICINKLFELASYFTVTVKKNSIMIGDK